MKGLLLATALAASLAAPARAAAPPDSHALESFAFDASLPLPRLKPLPPWLLQEWRDLDEMPGYEDYVPSKAEAESLASAFAGLPAPMRKVLSERLIAVHLVKGLKGNGLTTWVLDSSSRTFVYMLLNPAGFQQTLSELLTERDQTLFRSAADLKVEAGAGKGMLYSVAHESFHAYDYVKSLTPFTDEHLHRLLHPRAGPDAGWDVWAGYALPKPAEDYPLRSKLRFYGFGAPELDASRAPELCAQWGKTAFASFYGSRSWAEDLAELFVLRHLTEDLGQPLRRVCGGTVRSPWDDSKVRERALRLLKPLYAAPS